MSRLFFNVAGSVTPEPAACRTSGGLCQISEVLPEVLARYDALPELPEFELPVLFDTRDPVVMAAALVC